MPITRTPTKSTRLGTFLLLSSLTFSSVAFGAESVPAVAVVKNVAWSPGDAQREGACRLSIFLTVAQLKQSHRHVGLVGVGNYNGRLSSQAEQALEHVALRGIAVAKVAPRGGSVARTPDALFIDAGTLSEKEACQLLETCINRYGPLPAAVNPSKPTESEMQAIHGQIERYQAAFASAMGENVASRG